MVTKEELAEQLEGLRAEHRVLDGEIARVAEAGLFDDIEMHRLKKRKLAIKDQLSQLESDLLPDIIA
jgi:hypothetical protein